MNKALLRFALAFAVGTVCGSLPLAADAAPRAAAGLRAETRSGSHVPGTPGQEIKESQAASVWPLPSPFEWYWHRPDESLSLPQIRASLAGIRSGLFMSVTNNWKGPLSAVSVSLKRIEFEYRGESGPSKTFFPLHLLESMRLYYASAQPQGQKWLVVVTLTTQGVIQVYFETEAAARSFIDAAASAAKLAGIRLEDTEKRGFAVSDLSPAQAQALGKTRIDSALVSMIAYGGPAEKAGLRFLDLITEVDGVKVRNADHFVSILDAAGPGAELSLTCLERAEESEGGAPTYVWKPRTVLWKQAPRP
jgi:hypothetical protein